MRTDKIKPMCLQKNLPRVILCTQSLTGADLVSNRLFEVRIRRPTTSAMTRPFFGHHFSNAQTSGHEKTTAVFFKFYRFSERKDILSLCFCYLSVNNNPVPQKFTSLLRHSSCTNGNECYSIKETLTI